MQTCKKQKIKKKLQFSNHQKFVKILFVKIEHAKCFTIHLSKAMAFSKLCNIALLFRGNNK